MTPLVMAVLGALWSARTWQATLHALAGLVVVVGGWTVTAVVVVVWFAAVWSLAEGPTGAPGLAVVYAVVALVGLLPLLWWLRAFNAVQRVRFSVVLGIHLPTRPHAFGRLWSRLYVAWRSAATWREVGYHLVALVVGPVGGAAVAICWAATPVVIAYPGLPGSRIGLAVPAVGLLLAAPWVARGVATVDEFAARTLLGPSRAEQLARLVTTLSRSREGIVAATDAERRRIERDLHDGAQQRLVSLAMNLGIARQTLKDVPEPAMRVIEQAHDEAVEALTELREFIRGLHPAVLNDRGLDAALSAIVARSPLPVRLRVDMAERCSPSIEAIAYFAVSEALTNIAKHAAATRVEVSVDRRVDRLRVVVTDNGCGGASLGGGGTGLRGLAQRAAAVDGTLSVHSPIGGPTTITLELPCES